jgi:Rrf2 family protein
MRLTARSEYGLLAMIDLASQEDQAPTSARAISERQGIPAKFLEQLLVSLRRAGLVGAVRGAHGGFHLAKEPSNITVLEIVEVLEGPLSSSVCDGERSEVCGKNDSCAAGKVWGAATAAVRDVFDHTTLQDLVYDQRALDAS